MQQEIIPNFRLDLQGEPCPYPAVRTLEVLPLEFNHFADGYGCFA